MSLRHRRMLGRSEQFRSIVHEGYVLRGAEISLRGTVERRAASSTSWGPGDGRTSSWCRSIHPARFSGTGRRGLPSPRCRTRPPRIRSLRRRPTARGARASRSRALSAKPAPVTYCRYVQRKPDVYGHRRDRCGLIPAPSRTRGRNACPHNSGRQATGVPIPRDPAARPRSSGSASAS